VGERWRDCVVSFVDIAGTKRPGRERDSSGSRWMRELHKLLDGAMTPGLPSPKHAFCDQ
jgi:hypothetical protein